uniref:Peptidase S26 domain-containing protein n=1 Tax=Bionectria ochroleuca TaxID=29856 RepID=A0A0B7K2T9_BIOOC
MVVSHFMSHPIRLTISTIKLVCTWHIITSHVFQVSPAQGPSMLPTFSVKGDWLRVGDLVLYRIPVSDNANGIKRLIGLPGDYVSMNTPGSPGEERMIQVPEGHCWIVGDNLTVSRDSRSFGPVPLALIKGKVLAKVLPWAERGWFHNPLELIEDLGDGTVDE